MKGTQWKLLKQTCGEAWAVAKGTSLSGYLSLEELAKHEGTEGAVVIDARMLAEHKDVVGWVINDPLVNFELKDGDVEPFDRESLAAVLPGLGGHFKEIALVAHENPTWRGLDNVSLLEHVRTWRARGASIGKVVAGEIQWEAVC